MNNIPKKGDLLIILYNQFGSSPFVYRDIQQKDGWEISDKTLRMWSLSNHLSILKSEKLKYKIKNNDVNKRPVMYVHRYPKKYKLTPIAIKYCEKRASNF